MFDNSKTKTYSYETCYRCGCAFNKEEDQARINNYHIIGYYDTCFNAPVFLCKDCSTKLVKFLEEGAEL